MNRLNNKTAIITGAASGAGLGTVKLFLEEGANVVAVDLPSADFSSLHALADSDKLALVQQDITDKKAPQAITDAAIKQFGSINILVNNAAVLLASMADGLDLEVWDKLQDVNVRAGMTLASAVIPHLKQQRGGRIINISSAMAAFALPGLSGYCASKAAVCAMTRVLALELGEFGITANYIEPGSIDTPMISNVDEQGRQHWIEKTPLKRLGQPLDIARGALFLASEEASFITGQGIRIDGGALLSI